MPGRYANKRKSRKTFNNRAAKTSALNLRSPRRGGIRL